VVHLDALRRVQLYRGTQQSAIGPPRNRYDDFQIATDFHHGWRGRLRRLLPLGLQKQLRLIQKPLANRRGCSPPGGVELPRFPAAQAMPRKPLGHALAVFWTATRHWYQELHRHVRRDGAVAHLLLHTLRKQLDQPHAPRHPARAAIKTAGQLLQPIAEAMLQLHQKPAFFQRRLVIAATHGTIQKQSFDFAQRPDHRLHRVPAQLLKCRNPLVAVDDQVMLWTLGGHHDNRRLLPTGRQRRQQTPLTLRPMHPKVLQPSLKLVKFQPHHPRPLRRYHPNMDPEESGIARQERVVSMNVLWNEENRARTGIARSAAAVRP